MRKARTMLRNLSNWSLVDIFGSDYFLHYMGTEPLKTRLFLYQEHNVHFHFSFHEMLLTSCECQFSLFISWNATDLMEMAVFTFQLKTFQSFSLSLSLTILVLLSSPTLKTLEEPSWATLPGNFLFIEVLPALASRNLEICWAFPKVLPFPTVPLPALHLSILRKKRFISNPKCWNLKLRAGVSIIFKIWVFYKAWFERFEFFIV